MDVYRSYQQMIKNEYGKWFEKHIDEFYTIKHKVVM